HGSFHNVTSGLACGFRYFNSHDLNPLSRFAIPSSTDFKRCSSSWFFRCNKRGSGFRSALGA
ncbi:hypothetical protein SOP93_27705, partial [Peribacillus frigoritolerans]|uniref:hypothetical protein n=1 Tax=Peribacillus frigoritolerans TaxID=450367 RepID=UPI002B2481DA